MFGWFKKKKKRIEKSGKFIKVDGIGVETEDYNLAQVVAKTFKTGKMIKGEVDENGKLTMKELK